MRWRIEKEVFSGKGQFICGNKTCDKREGLKSYEVNFAYVEGGEQKNALVKLRLCPECAVMLNYYNDKKSKKRKEKEEKEREKEKEKEDKQHGKHKKVKTEHKADAYIKKEEEEDNNGMLHHSRHHYCVVLANYSSVTIAFEEAVHQLQLALCALWR